ncbi:hypothetical protein AYI69_g2139 [Smittium culicis]|uniref:Uncharacterized protein n=1 Tax=Smittium culicis TaxID=133412 RepID=A0A1R1YNH5_9FUNG|nr:hypothetical protein AYI69_g2139 [Smittium culicis]
MRGLKLRASYVASAALSHSHDDDKMRYGVAGKSWSGGDRVYSGLDGRDQDVVCPVVVALDMGGVSGGSSSGSSSKRDRIRADLGADIGLSLVTGAESLGGGSSSRMNDVAASMPALGEPEISGAATVALVASVATAPKPHAYSNRELAKSDEQRGADGKPIEFAGERAGVATGNSSSSRGGGSGTSIGVAASLQNSQFSMGGVPSNMQANSAAEKASVLREEASAVRITKIKSSRRKRPNNVKIE